MGKLSMKILIIDPDPKTREEFLSLLSGEGYEMETSAGLTQAVEKMKLIPFDCIIMDTHLPEIMGYEAVPVIKALLPQAKVIITTSENNKELELKVREQDIFYYYIKLFDPEELKLAVHDVFKRIKKSEEGIKMEGLAKILIVDDDPDYVEAIKVILNTKDYEVGCASNQKEAWEKILQMKPNIVLLDIMMERLDDGFTICYKLKHNPEFKNIRILAISAITQETGFKFSPKTDGEYFEADDYIEKPVEADELLKRIEKLLNKE